MRGVGRRLFQSESDQALDGRVIDAAGRAGAWRIDQPLQPMRGEAAPPQRHRLAADPQRFSHPQVGRARFGTGQDDAQTLNERLPGPVSAQQALDLTLLLLAEIERDCLRATRQGAPPSGSTQRSAHPTKLSNLF